jgi:hypothetical protein
MNTPLLRCALRIEPDGRAAPDVQVYSYSSVRLKADDFSNRIFIRRGSHPPVRGERDGKGVCRIHSRARHPALASAGHPPRPEAEAGGGRQRAERRRHDVIRRQSLPLGHRRVTRVAVLPAWEGARPTKRQDRLRAATTVVAAATLAAGGLIANTPDATWMASAARQLLPSRWRRPRLPREVGRAGFAGRPDGIPAAESGLIPGGGRSHLEAPRPFHAIPAAGIDPLCSEVRVHAEAIGRFAMLVPWKQAQARRAQAGRAEGTGKRSRVPGRKSP